MQGGSNLTSSCVAVFCQAFCISAVDVKKSLEVLEGGDCGDAKNYLQFLGGILESEKRIKG